MGRAQQLAGLGSVDRAKRLASSECTPCRGALPFEPGTDLAKAAFAQSALGSGADELENRGLGHGVTPEPAELRRHAGRQVRGLFPSALVHFVHPYHGPGERISIAYNFNIEGKGD